MQKKQGETSGGGSVREECLSPIVRKLTIIQEVHIM